MANEFKKCPNGHYYQGNTCPYCKSGVDQSSSTSAKTEVFTNQGTLDHDQYGDAHQPTMVSSGGNNGGGGQKTLVVEDGNIDRNMGVRPPNSGGMAPMSGRTVFGDDDETEVVSTSGGERVQRVYREARKLVGWLVSYTLDPLGVDFKLYEGRNIIGRDPDCSITVGDNRVSSKHAVLLFRAGKYSITDSQSSHGTFVNERDIELEPCYLSDGDIIQVGQTVFKFRSSL